MEGRGGVAINELIVKGKEAVFELASVAYVNYITYMKCRRI